MTTAIKRPAFQFYPADWQKDVELHGCSIGARGLWLELSCVMHECKPYGCLTLNGEPMPHDKAARLVGVDLREYRKLLAELEAAGVPSRTDSGVLYSRRMTRDEEVRNKRAAGGPKGAEFGMRGKEHGSKGGRPTKSKGATDAPIEPPLKPPPSSSSSSSDATTSRSNGADKSIPYGDLSGSTPDVASLDPKAAKTRELRRQAVELLAFLNEKTKRNYAPVPANVDPIVARLKDAGVTPDLVRQVIARKCRQWGADEKMDEYLRPKTLFNATNFANYAGEIVEPETQTEGAPT